MTSTHKRLKVGIVAGASTLALLLAACGSSSKSGSGATTSAAGAGTTAAGGATTAAGSPDLKGKTIKILGPETGAEADGVTEAFKAFETATGAKIQYTGTRDAETQIRTAAQAGGDALPDIFFAPQPGLVKDLASKLIEVDPAVVASMKADYDPYWTQLATIGGKVLGIPAKSDLKSIVWYSPKVFTEKGYKIPTTWAELTTLQDKMKADKIAPWCVGIESGEATGWPFTDWMEDIMLRLKGPDVYDKWVSHQIPFNDPQVKEVAQFVGNIWFTDGNVLDGRQAIASTGFANAGLPILDGKCGMHRQANFYGAQFKTAKPDVKFGPDGDVNVFYLPTISDQFGKVTLVAGVFAVAFNNNPATAAAMKYLESADYANNRIKANKGGFLSPNKNSDVNLYQDPLDKAMGAILVAAQPVRFDGSDSMPSAVGLGTFLKEGTNYVNGTEDVDAFLKNVEASWPKS
jgi:alpha-glucoside transport system substrate-binding protein